MADLPTASSRREFLTAQWLHLAMLNYEVDPAILAPLTPRGTQLDFFAGKTYVSVVGFLFLKTRLLGLPIPFHRNFEEVNLRFYVRRECDGEVRRGVAFIKELVPRWAIATVARTLYNENYQALPMRHYLQGFEAADEADGEPVVDYGWRFGGRWNAMRLRGVGQCQALSPGSLAQFIAEHYWGYCRQRDGGTIEYRVEHPSWHVWRGSEALLDCDVAPLYGQQYVDVLDGPPASAFLADGSAVSVSRPTRIC